MMASMLIKRVSVHSGKRISIDFRFRDEFESALALLGTVHAAYPDMPLKAFLEKGGRSAWSQQEKKTECNETT